MFRFAAPRAARRPSLTPMIDVVFLLLVFFMLASQFGQDGSLPIESGGAGAGDYSGPPRLIDLSPEGLRLNGLSIAEEDLAAALDQLTEAPTDLVVLRSRDGATVQALVDLMTSLRDAGFERLVVVE